LNLFNNQGAFKQILGYANRATNGLDASFDGESFNGNQYLDFTALLKIFSNSRRVPLLQQMK
jgi:hypothetical protein